MFAGLNCPISFYSKLINSYNPQNRRAQLTPPAVRIYGRWCGAECPRRVCVSATLRQYWRPSILAPCGAVSILPRFWRFRGVFGVICRGVVQSLARDIIALYTPVFVDCQDLIHRRRNLAPVLAVSVCLACPSCGVLYRYTGAAVTIYGGGRVTPDRPPRRCRCLCRTDGRTLLVTPAVFLSRSVISVLRRYSPALAGRAGYLWRLARPRQYWRPSLSVVCPCPLRGCLSCRLSMSNLQPCGVSRPACGLNTASRAGYYSARKSLLYSARVASLAPSLVILRTDRRASVSACMSATLPRVTC